MQVHAVPQILTDSSSVTPKASAIESLASLIFNFVGNNFKFILFALSIDKIFADAPLSKAIMSS